jgi:hypothetical protein
MKRQNRSEAALLIALTLVAVSCGGGSGFPSISINLDISEQTIPGSAPPAVQGSCNPSVQGGGSLSPDSITPISFDLRASKELQGKSFLRFADVFLDKVTLRIVPPSQAGQTWDFLDSIRLFADDDPSDSNPPVLVAVLDPVPRGATEIVIPGNGVDISDIASANRFTVTGEVRGRPPCADVHFVGKADFEVTI